MWSKDSTDFNSLKLKCHMVKFQRYKTNFGSCHVHNTRDISTYFLTTDT